MAQTRPNRAAPAAAMATSAADASNAVGAASAQGPESTPADPDDASCTGDDAGTLALPSAVSRLEILIEALDRAARPAGSVEPHVSAFKAWITADDEAMHTLAALADEAAALDGGARTYRHVAVLGYAASLGVADHPPRREAVHGGVAWVAGREWFAPGRVPSFEADQVALLGVALAVRELADEGGTTGPSGDKVSKLVEWIAALLNRALALTADSWERGLVEAALYFVAPPPEGAGRIAAAAPDLSTALCARGLLPGAELTDAHEAEGLGTIFALSYRQSGPERAAAQRVALRWLLRATPAALPGRAGAADVLAVLYGVARSLRRWRWEESASTRNAPIVRWEVNNEYHLQDILWIVLAPLFPDLQDEEGLPSLGQKHPRADLTIPSLRLIVEAKFTRRGDAREFAKVIEEVAADASLYLRDPAKYTNMIAVVWDDSRHTEQHAELTQGLIGIPGVVGAVVLTRPGRMGDGLRSPRSPVDLRSEPL